jgi:hypothetical protein
MACTISGEPVSQAATLVNGNKICRSEPLQAIWALPRRLRKPVAKRCRCAIQLCSPETEGTGPSQINCINALVWATS